MKKQSVRLVSFLLLTLLVAVACITASNPTLPPPGYPFTLAAKTWQAMQTAFTPTPSKVPVQVIQLTDTLRPTDTPWNTRTLFPSITPVPSLTQRPTNTMTLTPTITLTPTKTPVISGGGDGGGGGGGGSTSTSIPCNAAELITSITIPDGSALPSETRFTKIWRIQNTGSCKWDAKYSFFLAQGDAIGAPHSLSLPKIVKPGDTMDMAVDMVAPVSPGGYVGKWLLDSNRETFGDQGNGKFVVSIDVNAPPADGTLFDLAKSFCTAVWHNSSGKLLECPGGAKDRFGFAYLGNLRVETGGRLNVLATHPPNAVGAWIRGAYPYIKLPANSRFQSEVGCLYGYKDCDVTFTVYAQYWAGPRVQIGQANETLDGTTQNIDVVINTDPYPFISLILVVEANANPQDAAAFWFKPRIVTGTVPYP